MPHARICCYHSQLWMLQRWHIEKTLDEVLTRKNQDWKRTTIENLEIQNILQSALSAGYESVPIIVVATPVEEIGRDHDFDWAVIEPSSSQSIVQVAGRVNRHRLSPVEFPNIAVLQFNLRYLQRGEDGPSFTRPGLESELTMPLYGDHGISTLINWEAIANCGQIDARLRYQTTVHPFAQADDQSLKMSIEQHMKKFLNSSKQHWLMKDIYVDATLREGSNNRDEYFVTSSGEFFRKEPNGRTGRDFRSVRRNPDETIEKVPNDWLSLTFDQVTALANRTGISTEAATTVQINRYGPAENVAYLWDASFGYQNITN